MQTNTFKTYLIAAMLFVNTLASAQHIRLLQDTTEIPVIELPEFVVKSAKSEVKVKDLPTAVSHIDATAIQQKELTSTKALSAIVPNLYMPDYGSKLTSPIYLRGIGSKINSPSVGLYVDHVPYFEKSTYDIDLIDVESIEVLRGPQGTLYGRNTMGGIINIYTRAPKDQRITELTAEGGNYDRFKGSIYHNQPLSDAFSLNLSGSYTSLGGYFTNEYLNEQVDDLEAATGRARLMFNPGKRFKAEFITSYDYSAQGGYPYAAYDDETGISQPISYNRYSSYDRDMLANNLYMQFLFDHFILESNSSYQYFDDKQGIDQDFSPIDKYFVTQDQDQNMFSQELTLKSPGQQDLDWLFGAFAFRQGNDRQVALDFGSFFEGNPKAPADYVKDYDFVTKGFALFHQATIHDYIVDGLSLTIGIRMDYEKASLDYLHNLVKEGNMTEFNKFYDELDFIAFSPKIGLKYTISKNANIYGSITKGYKTGGFNTSFDREDERTFDPESSWNYEVGLKSSWLDNRLMANLAFFYIDWSDQQIYQTLDTGRGSKLTNAGESESKGVEIELSYRPVDKLRTFFNYGYTEATFTDYKKSESVDYSGHFIPLVPRYTLSTGANYTIDLKSKLFNAMIIDVTYNGIGDIYWYEDNVAKQSYYGLLNGKLTFTGHRFDIGIWGKNLLDESYNAYYFPMGASRFVQAGRPLTFGASLKVKI
ncbi:TonB-dependent receptor [Marinilabiliaceae bacterium JC017]|nr:TonB-dependent receptor [Marinilabiliaceae bacterium JC017]